MKKATVSVLAALTICGSLAMPAMAAGSGASTGSSSGSDAGSMLQNTAMLPVRVVAVGAGLVVGTPVALARRTTVRIREYTKTFADKIGGSKDFPPNFFASFLSVPCGLIVGTGEGFFYGGKNGIDGFDKPFSTDSFSLGSMEQ